MRLSPCKGCAKRELGCHSRCKDYLDWKEEWDEAQENAKREREINTLLSEPKINRRIKYLRNKRRR